MKIYELIQRKSKDTDIETLELRDDLECLIVQAESYPLAVQNGDCNRNPFLVTKLLDLKEIKKSVSNFIDELLLENLEYEDILTEVSIFLDSKIGFENLSIIRGMEFVFRDVSVWTRPKEFVYLSRAVNLGFFDADEIIKKIESGENPEELDKLARELPVSIELEIIEEINETENKFTVKIDTTLKDFFEKDFLAYQEIKEKLNHLSAKEGKGCKRIFELANFLSLRDHHLYDWDFDDNVDEYSLSVKTIDTNIPLYSEIFSKVKDFSKEKTAMDLLSSYSSPFVRIRERGGVEIQDCFLYSYLSNKVLPEIRELQPVDTEDLKAQVFSKLDDFFEFVDSYLEENPFLPSFKKFKKAINLINSNSYFFKFQDNEYGNSYDGVNSDFHKVFEVENHFEDKTVYRYKDTNLYFLEGSRMGINGYNYGIFIKVENDDDVELLKYITIDEILFIKNPYSNEFYDKELGMVDKSLNPSEVAEIILEGDVLNYFTQKNKKRKFKP